MRQADRVRYDIYRRTRVRQRAMLAERQFSVGHLEAACATWQQVLDDYPLVQSARADEHIRTMRTLIRPHLSNRAARAVHERARALVDAAA